MFDRLVDRGVSGHALLMSLACSCVIENKPVMPVPESAMIVFLVCVMLRGKRASLPHVLVLVYATNARRTRSINYEISRIARSRLFPLLKISFVCKHFAKKYRSVAGAQVFDVQLELSKKNIETCCRDSLASLRHTQLGFDRHLHLM